MTPSTLLDASFLGITYETWDGIFPSTMKVNVIGCIMLLQLPVSAQMFTILSISVYLVSLINGDGKASIEQ